MTPPKRDARVWTALNKVDSALRQLYRQEPSSFEIEEQREAWVMAINACLLELERVGREYGPRYAIATKRAAPPKPARRRPGGKSINWDDPDDDTQPPGPIGQALGNLR